MRLGLVDLFAGAGGLSIGFEQEGFEVVAAVETVAAYAATHARNFPKCQTFNVDIRTLDLDALRGVVANAGPFDALVVAGGPPCQSFSTIGRPKIRSLQVGNEFNLDDDHRDYLFSDFFRVVELLQPSAFVMENVPEIKSKKGGAIFAECVRIATRLGYFVEAAVLNAAHFGAPQTRRRMFLVGSKLGPFKFPIPTHSLEPQGSLLGLGSPDFSPAVTVQEALSDLPIIFDGIRAGRLPYSKPHADNVYQERLRSLSGQVGNNVCRISNERAKRLFPHLPPGGKYMDLPPKIRKILPFREDIFADRLKRLHPERPSWTVIAHIGMDGYMYIHPWENRTLSVREAARLQSFPDDFEFTGNMREQYIQVGNAVPPLMASVLARSLHHSLMKRGLAA